MSIPSFEQLINKKKLVGNVNLKQTTLKKLIVGILVFVISHNLYAQDIIIKKDGAKIETKVIEVGVSDLKYKNFTNMNGPLYTLLKSDIKEVKYENGEIETYNTITKSGEPKSSDKNNSKTKVFIKTTADSDVQPTPEVWNSEIESSSVLSKVDKIEDADLIFEFKITRAMGEARVSVNVFNAKNDKLLWESKKYRGTANVYNKMGASLHGIRQCIKKGIIPAMEDKIF